MQSCVSDVSLNRKIEKIEDNNTITETHDDEEDCGCEVVSSQHLIRLERLLNRVKIYTNVISILSKNNPSQYPIIICNVLISIFWTLSGICYILYFYGYGLKALGWKIIGELFLNLFEKFIPVMEGVLFLLGEFDCPPP